MTTQRVSGLFLSLSALVIAGCDSTPPAETATQTDPPRIEAVAQELLSFPIVVEDADGQPIEGAVLKPWALRSSLGHGGWNGESTGGTGPQEVTTDANGLAMVEYPKFHSVDEQIAVTAVTVSIDHPNHPHVSHEDVTVPPTSADPHVASLPPGAAIEVTVTQDGKPINDKNIRAIWNDGRRYYDGTEETVANNGKVRIPPLKEGSAQLMLVRVDGYKATHFSEVQDLEVVASEEPIQLEVKIQPALPIRGKLSDNVPRPVRNGRVKLESIGDGDSWSGVEWFDWAQVATDGTFVIDAWPQNEPVQLIALCDGYIAANGKAPAMVPPERATGSGLRAQVFMEPQVSEIVVDMAPMVRCRFECKNAFDKPLPDIEVASWPNIRWWNSGSQVYCTRLVDPINFLKGGKYESSGDAKQIPQSFRGMTDASGMVEIDLPAGHASVSTNSDRYQLAARGGRRSRKMFVGREKPVLEQLVLQPKGLDCLGDWEDLCGLVFG